MPVHTALERALHFLRPPGSRRLVGANAYLEDVTGLLGRDGRPAPLGDRGQELRDAGAQVPGRPGNLGLGPLAAAVQLHERPFSSLGLEREHALAAVELELWPPGREHVVAGVERRPDALAEVQQQERAGVD